MRNRAARWASRSASIAIACALYACTEDTGTTGDPSTAAGASGAPIGGAAGAAGVGGTGAGGVSGAGGTGAAGTGTAGGASGMGAGGTQGAGTGGMQAAGAGGTTAGAGGMAGGGSGMSGAGTGGMSAGTGGMSGAGAGAGGQSGSGGGDVTFSAVYAIISAKCGGCHTTSTSGGLSMPNAATAYDNLVGVESQQCDGETRVIAGNAAGSLIVKAVEGTACVERMPRGRAALTATEIMTIRDWIDDGALE